MHRFRSRLNTLLGMLIAALGVTSCRHKQVSEQVVMVKYGVPRADFRIEGRVVSPEGRPLERMRVVVDLPNNVSDTAFTDQNGRFLITRDGFPADSATISVTDPRGRYRSHEVRTKIGYEATTRDVWNQGTGTVEIIVSLEPVKPRIDRGGEAVALYGVRPPVLKYGPPPTRLPDH